MHACDVVGIDVAPCPDLRPETPQGLSPLSYSGHTPSPLVLVFDQGEALPRKPMDLPRFVTSMQLVVRSLGCLPPWDVACMEAHAPVGALPWSSRTEEPFSRCRSSGHFSRPNTEAPTYRVRQAAQPLLPGTYPTPFSRFDSFVLAVAWTPSLTFALVPKAIENAALSVSAPTVTGKPSRALEQVELFPARAFNSGPRRPHDLRHGTSRCSWVPCPDTLNEAGLIDHTARVRPQAAGSYSYTR